MGKQQASLYYTANLHTRSGILRGLPILAAHVGGGDNDPSWDSGRIKNFVEFKQMFERIDPTVPAYIAVPQIYAGTFTPGIEYERIDIDAWSKSGGYRSGRVAYATARNFEVEEASSVASSELPDQPKIQQEQLDKTLGHGIVFFMSMKLRVVGEVVVSL